MRSKSPRAHHRLIELPDEDPLSGMANLFDTGMVFAVALMLALVSFYQLPEQLRPSKLEGSRTPALEELTDEGVTVERFRISEEILGGEGERLGIAYRLQSGEVVYVPEPEEQ